MNNEKLIIEVWERLDCESVGAAELEAIQAAVGAVDSPAAIARLLADEGAVLRHPEVLDADAAWREKALLARASELDFTSLSAAIVSIRKLEALRKAGDKIDELAADAQDELTLMIHSPTADERRRSDAKEIVEWLKLWRRTPDLFENWLELRLKVLAADNADNADLLS